MAGQKYPSVVSSAQGVGTVLAEAVNEMVDQGLPINSIHLVGHSMGAQVAGFLGRQTSFELRRITGELASLAIADLSKAESVCVSIGRPCCT